MDRGTGWLGREDFPTPVHMERDINNVSLHLSQLRSRTHPELENTPKQVQPCSFISTSLLPLSPKEKSTSIQSYLEQLEQNIGMRQLTSEAEKVRIGLTVELFTMPCTCKEFE